MFINNLAYEASAGSGKTFMLVVRYLSLLFLGAEPSKILALTFTNKAANEMQERIVATLEELQNRGELDEIAKVTSLSKEYLLENRQRVLNEFLNSHTKIMTIDSFFTRILRKFSLYASLMPDFSTFSAQHELKLLSRFLKEVSVAGKKETLVSFWSDSNKKATDILNLLDAFYVKFSELRDTEFKKQNRLLFEEEALGYMYELKKILSSCKDASSTALKGFEAEKFEDIVAKSWLERDSLNYRTFSKCYTPQMDELLLKLKEALKNQSRAKEQNFFFALKELLSIYIKSKKALYMDDSELSFNDVTYLVYEILNLIQDSEFLYFRLDAQIEHMLLDEFQDTSILQYEILKPLIKEITSGSGIFDNGSFFFVGDVKQSIYRFRGGVSALFDVVANQNNTHVEKLLVNYRSQKEVVSFVNFVFKGKIKNYTPQLVKSGSDGGFVEVIQNDEILDEIVMQVKRVLELGANIDEIAVLCATNKDGEEIECMLKKEGIDVVTETTTKLINQKSVRALLEYLKYQYFGEEIYLLNFFALISQEAVAIKRVDLNRVTLLELLKDAIERFGLFSGDFNIIKFLDAISKYNDIEALLFEYERMDVSAAVFELHGVRVLTVHKSKGLEYEHVIVADRLSDPPFSRDSVIYEYEGIILKNIYLRTKGRELFDRQYADALLKEAKLAYEDSLNALYVAFTRAKESLIIIAKSKKSIFASLDLEPMRMGEFLSPKNRHSSKEPKELHALEYKKLYYGTQSAVLEGEKAEQESLKSINFGLAMHYMLQMIGEFKEQSIYAPYHMMLNKYGSILEDEEINEIEKRVKMLLKNNDFLSLVEGEVFREKALKVKNSLRYIDLLIKKEWGWVVVDYKSSMNFMQEHHSQVASYVKTVQKITNERVEGFVCYLLGHETKVVKV